MDWLDNDAYRPLVAGLCLALVGVAYNFLKKRAPHNIWAHWAFWSGRVGVRLIWVAMAVWITWAVFGY